MTTVDHAGERLFARYAYAPNDLGYCGPAQSKILLECGAGAGDPARVREVARGFSGAWPYLRILARLAGIDDALDPRVVDAYWIGGGLGDTIDHRAFGETLLADIGRQAGHYWRHLTPDIIEEAAPNHCFHVFGVYPWSRLLGARNNEQPLRVLDKCRIAWGTILDRPTPDRIHVRTRQLLWDGTRLTLSAPRITEATLSIAGHAFVPDPHPGDRVALHWDLVTDRLTEDQVERLRRTTLRQIEATNRRIGRPMRHTQPPRNDR